MMSLLFLAGFLLRTVFILFLFRRIESFLEMDALRSAFKIVQAANDCVFVLEGERVLEGLELGAFGGAVLQVYASIATFVVAKCQNFYQR